MWGSRGALGTTENTESTETRGPTPCHPGEPRSGLIRDLLYRPRKAGPGPPPLRGYVRDDKEEEAQPLSVLSVFSVANPSWQDRARRRQRI